jgi:hypothetical protein
MPSKDRMVQMYRRLLEAALDQPQPTKELIEAIQPLLGANEHSLRLKLQVIAPACTCGMRDPLSPMPLAEDYVNPLCPIHGVTDAAKR